MIDVGIKKDCHNHLDARIAGGALYKELHKGYRNRPNKVKVGYPWHMGGVVMVHTRLIMVSHSSFTYTHISVRVRFICALKYRYTRA
jgi:hypothetical protein